jgi:hypothetical protein
MALCLFAGACGFEPDSLPELTPIPDPNPDPDPVPSPDPVPEPSPEPPQPFWTLVYKANGGEGTMSNSTAQAGEALTLKTNTFTRTYCTFAGWAESKAGPMAYGNGLSVPGQDTETTLTLYALWTVTSGKETDFVTAATSGNIIALPNVVWSPSLGTALEIALSNVGMTLNLSGVSGLTEWSKDTLSSNKANIKSLVLPDTVTLLKDAANQTDAVFNGYISLESVSGAGVTDIGGYAFGSCTKLTKVELPAAKNIGIRAFSYCQALAELFLPANPPALAISIFEYTTDPVPLNIYVGLGNVPAYTSPSGWGVSAATLANGNTAKYGNNHKAITIME